MKITFTNVDKLIFYNNDIQRILPEIFEKWAYGTRTGIDSIVKKARLDFINNMTPELIEKLESYFGSPVIVEKLDPSLVKNYVIDVSKLGELFNDMIEFGGNLSISREGDLIYICKWR